MDAIFAKASNQAVSFAIRSGISLASGFAIKTITSFISQIPKSAQQLRIEKQRRKLHLKIEILTPTIELIKLANARSSSILDSTIELIDELHAQFTEFDNHLSEILTGLNSKNEVEATEKVEKYMNRLLQDINEAIPVLNLALLTSGVNFSGQTNSKNVSPGRLLQAANYLDNSKGDQIGPDFDLVMYTIFYNPSRLKYVEGEEFDDLKSISWKETYARSSVKIVKGKGKFEYKLQIIEDFNDGRYHEDDDKPSKREFDLKLIERMFFTGSGKLLRLEERNSPVLIIKLVDQEEEEWIALGELNKGEFDDDDEDDEEKDQKETAEKEINVKASNPLSLLEYILRLARLQEMQSKSILEIPDEILSIYLHDEPAEPHIQKQPTNTTSALTMDSNITRLQNLQIDAESKKSINK